MVDNKVTGVVQCNGDNGLENNRRNERRLGQRGNERHELLL
jgi:hypothetical protein